jgi:hypothetical protein
MAATYSWQPPLDPLEIKDYLFRLTKELTAAADTLPVDDAAAVWTLSPIASTAGLLIHASSHTTTDLTVWLKVNPSQAAAGMFDAPGTRLELSFIATTVGGRKYHRTVSVLIQKL